MKIFLSALIALSSLLSLSSFAQSPCYMNYCVGEQVYNVTRESRMVRILGIDGYGKFTVQFIDNGGIGGNWDYFDFAKTYGCTTDGRACVGMTAYNILRNYRQVSIAGIQSNNLLVLKYLDNGGIGGGWSVTDLSFTSNPTPPYCPAGTVWNPRTQRCEPRQPYCPAGTHWDPRLNRCVSDYPNPSFFTCMINVNGRSFIGRGQDTIRAGDVAIRQCLQAGYGSFCNRNAVVCRRN